MALIVNSFQELDNSFLVYLPLNGDKNVECPHCHGLGPFWINKYYWRAVNHTHMDGKLVYNVKIERIYIQVKQFEMKLYGR